MPRLSLGLGVQTIRKVGGGLITTSKAFNILGIQVGSTNTGAIPSSWLESESTVTSVIFANDNSVTSIGSFAFYNCVSLTSITIPNSVTSIGTSVFYNCTALTSVTIPASVTSIGENAFRQCPNITSITIPNSVTSIGSYAFSYCSNLTTATIGTGVTSIGDSAFKECQSLATVLCYVAQSAFTGNNVLDATASPLTIRARSTDSSWTAGTGLTFQGNANVTVIKNL